MFIVLNEHLTSGTCLIIDMLGINEDVSLYKQWKFQHKYCGFWPPASLWSIQPCQGLSRWRLNYLPVRSETAKHVCALSCFSHVRLCGTMNCSPPGSSAHGVLQARILEWVAVPSSRGSYWSRDQSCISYVYLHWQAGSLSLVPPGKTPEMAMLSHIYYTRVSFTVIFRKASTMEAVLEHSLLAHV